MSSQLRIGLWVEPTDAFWVEIREAFFHRSRQVSLDLVPITYPGFPFDPSPDEQHSILEQIMSQDLDVLIGWGFPEQMAYPYLNMGLPIVHMSETNIDHPLDSPDCGYAWAVFRGQPGTRIGSTAVLEFHQTHAFEYRRALHYADPP